MRETAAEENRQSERHLLGCPEITLTALDTGVGIDDGPTPLLLLLLRT